MHCAVHFVVQLGAGCLSFVFKGKTCYLWIQRGMRSIIDALMITFLLLRKSRIKADHCMRQLNWEKMQIASSLKL